MIQNGVWLIVLKSQDHLIKWKRSKKAKKYDDDYKKNGDKYQNSIERSNPQPLDSGFHAHVSPSANQLPVVHKEPSQVNIPRIKSNQLTAPVRAYVAANPDSRHPGPLDLRHPGPPDSRHPVTAYRPVPLPPGTSPSRSMFPVEPISVYPSDPSTPTGRDNTGNSLPFDPKNVGYFEQRTEKVTVYRSNSGDDIDRLRRRRSAKCQNTKCATEETSFIDDTFKPALHSAKEYLHEKKDKAEDVLHEAKSRLRRGRRSAKCQTTKCPSRQTSFIDDTLKPALHSAKEYLHEKKDEVEDVLHGAKSELMRTSSGLAQNIRSVTHKATHNKYCPSCYQFVFVLFILIMLALIVYLVYQLWIYFSESDEMFHGEGCYCRACRNRYRYVFY